VVADPTTFSLFVPYAAFASVGTFSFANITSLQFTFNNTGVPDVDFQLEQIVAVGQNPSFNFGNFPIPAGLSGGKFVDSDQNGMRDPGEPPVAGVIITLTGTNDLGQPVLVQTQTAADGTYSFTGLRPGTYTLTETPPINFIIGMPHLGSLGGTIVTNVVMGNIVVNGGDNGINYDFLEVGLTPPFVSKRAFIVPEIEEPLVAVYDAAPVTTTATAASSTSSATTQTTAAVKTTTTVTASSSTKKKKDKDTKKKASNSSKANSAKLPFAATTSKKRK
jgi:hypothetical protein